ncbi:3-phosphoshikimate 1-carboxyvinyltransferase [Candidatus Omnitrophota bacterium]
MNLVLKPTSQLKGTVCAPPSKSYSIRAVFIASLGNRSIINNLSQCDDVEASIGVCKSFGAHIKRVKSNIWQVQGVKNKITFPTKFNVRESGTTLRFLLSLVSLAEQKLIVRGQGTLNFRPNSPLVAVLRKHGAQIRGTGRKESTPILVKKGRVKGGKIEIDGGLSSQFISSLLMLAPLLSQDSTIKVTGPIFVSEPYIDMTLLVAQKASIKIRKAGKRIYKVKGKQLYRSLGKFCIPGDYGLSAYFMAAAALTQSKLTLQGFTGRGLPQADKRILFFLKKMGVHYSTSGAGIKLQGPFTLKGSNLFCRDCPDLVPILGVLALFARGKTKIYGVAHAKAKESNRISDLASELRTVGARIREIKDGLIIFPHQKLKTGQVLNPHQDHRLAMAFSILGIKLGATVKDIECVTKSYPSFLADLARIKAKYILV